MLIRDYDFERDAKATHRIWRETGWLEDEKHEPAMDLFVRGATALVAEVNGEAECLACSVPGTMRHLEHEVPLGVVASVTTSRVARKQGIAGRLTAALTARQAQEGAAVSALGMFEQGFYSRLGFGTGPYEHWITFDPATLQIPVGFRPPQRLGADDTEAMHQALLNRYRSHGGCNIAPLSYVQSDLKWASNGFGLGYYDGADGSLSHFFWCNIRGQSYDIGLMAYRTWNEFLELMAVIRSFGDQVRVVGMREPADVQLQDFLRQPFMRSIISKKTDFETGNRATAYWQARITDLPACLEQTHLPGGPLRFTLQLSDPIEDFLDDDAPWRGIGGQYVVTLGPDSNAVSGVDADLPTLSASVGAFTRMWLGVRPATGLAVSDELSGPTELLRDLDRVLRLPVPHPEWDF